MTEHEYNKVCALSIARPIPVEMIPLVLQYARLKNSEATINFVAKWIQATLQVAMTGSHPALPSRA